MEIELPSHETPMTTPPHSPYTSNQNKQFFLYGFMGLLAVAVILTVVVTIVRVYSRAADDNFSLAFAKALHLPAAKVNGLPILYSDYAEDLKAINTMQAYAKAHGGSPTGDLTPEKMSDQVILRLVSNALLNQAAKQYNVSVTAQDVTDLTTQVLQQFKTPSDADSELLQRYGWNLATYQQKVMKPFILQNKLTDKIQADTAAREEVRKRAESVLNQIKAGADFASMAKQYGEDGTAALGGDLGFFGKGDMVPQFESAAFGLKKGQLSQELVESPYGYHIIKLTDRKTETAKNSSGKNATIEKVRASHILFMFPSAQKYMDQLVEQANIHIYLRIHNPFDALKQKLAEPTATSTS